MGDIQRALNGRHLLDLLLITITTLQVSVPNISWITKDFLDSGSNPLFSGFSGSRGSVVFNTYIYV
jgi:hypothetical protein